MKAATLLLFITFVQIESLLIGSIQVPSMYMMFGVPPTQFMNISLTVRSPFEICHSDQNLPDSSVEVTNYLSFLISKGKVVILGYKQRSPFEQCKLSVYAKKIEEFGAIGILVVNDVNDEDLRHINSVVESDLSERNVLSSISYDLGVNSIALQVSK